MKINKIIAILALFLLFNCDYQPIYSSKNIQKNYNFTINSIIFSGNNKINQEEIRFREARITSLEDQIKQNREMKSKKM